MVNKKTLKIILIAVAASLLVSCSGKQNNSLECVNSFVKAAEEHDMSKAWNTLSPEAQKFYNDIGEKNRKSGRGILEHDISEIVKFRSKSDYKVAPDPANPSIVRITTINGGVFMVETTDINGEFKLKDGTSVRNAIKGIGAEMVIKEYY